MEKNLAYTHFELFDPYKKYEYVESGLEEKYTTCLDKSGVVKNSGLGRFKQISLV